MTGGSGFGLTAAAKAGLLKRFATKSGPSAAGVTPIVKPAPDSPWTNLPLYKDLNSLRELANGLGIADPFFRSHEGIATGQTLIGNQTYINFSAYDYLGLNGDPRITKASMAAIERYGTSVSASRLVSGERPLHRELEEAIAGIYGTEDAVCFVSGHATNVTVIGQILKPGDLILHDELSHNSILQGAQLSGAKRFGFAHNEPAALEKLLKAHRKGATRALIVIEGHYSMDGDVPDLPRFVALAKAHDCWLMVDEAHGLGVLGEKGNGIHEHCGVASTDVDIWMGTLSKTLVSCGGYIAGRRELVDYLKRTAPGFVYSVGIAPAVAAAALEATKIFRAEPERVARLKANGQRFRAGAQAAGFDTGQSIGASIVPVITGSSMKAAKLSAGLMDRGVNVQPILYPAVPERTSRLRFFISAAHTDQQIDDTIQILAEEWKK